jgi:hypothetical protein
MRSTDLTPLLKRGERIGWAMKIFWSYAKLDDREPHKLSKLRRAFKNSLDQTLGYENKIIVDVSDLRWGVEWKTEIEKLILNCDAVIALISPSYFNSRMCIHELKIALSANKRILPIYYRNCKNGLKSTFKEEGNDENAELNRISKKIEAIQYMDFRKLKNKDFDSEVVQDFLDKIANELA